MRFMRKKVFKKRLTTAMVAYMINMTFMGFWVTLTTSSTVYQWSADGGVRMVSEEVEVL